MRTTRGREAAPMTPWIVTVRLTLEAVPGRAALEEVAHAPTPPGGARLDDGDYRHPEQVLTLVLAADATHPLDAHQAALTTVRALDLGPVRSLHVTARPRVQVP